MNQKNPKKFRSTKKSNKRKNSTQKVPSWHKDHELVTKSATINELGGFPGMYHWRYGASGTNAVFAISANPSSMFNFGLNFPTNVLGYGFPTLSLVYDTYFIKKSTIHTTIFNKSTTESYRYTIAPYNFDESAAYPTTVDDQWANNPFSVSTVVANSGSENVKQLNNSTTIPRLAGLPKIDQANDSYSGYIGGSNSLNTFSKPLEQYRWNVSVQSLDGSSIPAATLYMAWNIIYDIVFFDKLPLGI
jgi:hypothetical protein